ncbi:hypothetical protein ACTQ32_01725 [Roseburia faecis]|uniref:hypothetical protein n=2 Tax=Roseburia faecis TaxID=301302 RepID=UPI003F9DCAAE
MKQREIWKRIGIGLLSATLLLGNVQCVWASENPESLNTSAYSEYNISLSTSRTKGTRDELGLLGSGLTISWTPVGELTDHAELRASIDKYLGVTGEGKSKQGSLYTNIKGQNDYNNVFSVAMNNSAVEKALNTNKNFIANAACNSYTDLDIDDEEKCVNMALNAYFNLLPDGTEANADASLTRAQFMAMVMRADTPVTEIQTDTAFEKSVGQSEYNRYAQSVNKDSYLTLNNQLYNSSMTRAEAVYTIVSRYYADSLKNASSSASCYTDAKDGGAVAKSDRASALNNSISNPDSGMDRELYKSLCVAKEKNLLTSARSRWDEAITKNEAIALLRSVYTHKLVECNVKGTLLTSSSTNKTTTVKKATAKKQTVKIKKYKKSKKLYVKKATKAYKVTSTGKLKVAKSLKKSVKVTVVGTSTVKKIKYYAIKSGKSTMLVKQSLLSKTKPHSAKPSKPSTNSSNTTASHPQNNTPSGYKGPKNDNSLREDKNGVALPTDIKKVKVVNGKVEYRDMDGKIKYAKYRSVKNSGYVYYEYWYNYREDGMWIDVSMTDLTQYPEWAIDNIYEEAHGTIY